MKILTLQEVQAESLRVLMEFDAFCRDNSLEYSIAYGTLIGAIRHKGFIPWDDDIDVYMTRPQYEKFIHLYKDSKDFAMVYPGKDECTVCYGRLCDMSRTRVVSKSPWTSIDCGVWIDIFPVDAVPEDAEATRKKFLRCHRMYRRLLGKRRVQRYWSSGKFADKLKAIPTFLLNGSNPAGYAAKMDRYFTEFSYGSTPKVMVLSAPMGKRVVRNPIAEFGSYIDLPFEDKTVMAVAAYDSVLTNQFGDYMTPPPVDQQVRGHSVHTYTWR